MKVKKLTLNGWIKDVFWLKITFETVEKKRKWKERKYKDKIVWTKRKRVRMKENEWNDSIDTA